MLILFYLISFISTAVCEENVVIPEGTTEIVKQAYFNCTKLINLTLPSTLRIIGTAAFQYCTNFLGPLIIPDNVITIEYGAFEHCEKLTSLTLGKKVKTLGNYAFAICYEIYGNLIIPDSVTDIGIYSFISCTSITSVSISKSLKIIPESAFSRCLNLKGEIIIPDLVTEIGIHAFYNCTHINSVKFNNKLETIGEIAFQYCDVLKGPVIIPSSMKTIGANVFQYTQVKEIIFEGTTEPNCPLAFPDEDIESIKAYVSDGYSSATFCRLKIYEFESITESLAMTPEPTATCSESPEMTPEPTATCSESPEMTPEPTATCSESPEMTQEPTATCSVSPEMTPEPTATCSESPEMTPEPTATCSESPEMTPEPTATCSESPEMTPEPTETFSESPKMTPEPTETFSESPKMTPEPTETKSDLFESITEKVESDSEPIESDSEKVDYTSEIFDSNSEKVDGISEVSESNEINPESATESDELDITSSFSTEEPIIDGIDEPEIENINTTSTTIELTNNGFMSREIGELECTEKKINIGSKTLKMITFLSDKITISERKDNKLSTTLYFGASTEGSVIEIDKSVTRSAIGISSNYSPTVMVVKGDLSLNFVNNISNGYVTIYVPKSGNYRDIARFNFNEVHNFKGSLIITVPSSIRIVSFLKLSMYRKSFFEITHNEQFYSINNNHYKIKDISNSVAILIRELITLSSNSQATLINTNIFGTLKIYDDSKLELLGNSNVSDESKFIVFLQKIGAYFLKLPIIIFKDKFNSIPSNIVLSHGPNIKKIDMSNFSIIGSPSFPRCEDLGKRLIFETLKRETISYECQIKDDLTCLIISAKEKDKKKLSAGAIAGIVVGCSVAVIIFIAAFIYLIKVNNHSYSTKDENDLTSTSQ